MASPLADRLAQQLGRASSVYREYPRQFWILVGGTFVDRLGSALLFPFFTLYVTARFGVGMTQVGVLFALFAASSVGGSMLGGALTDRLGRKSMFLFGLIASALSSVLMGLVDTISWFAVTAILVGLLADAGGPAQQAMVADLLPEEKRAEGFGILRVVVNLAVTIGPMIGGLLAARSYLFLFLADAATSLVTAAIVFWALEESRPAPDASAGPAEGVAETFAGYLDVLRNSAFAWFLVASVLAVLVYMQMNTTLAVYLRDSHGVSEQGFGYILSLNAGMVVLLQFPVTRWASKYRPLLVMALGTLLYAVGFAMYGVVATYGLFLVAMAVITVGEMLTAPVGQAIAARLAPGDMRGRYMAVYGFSWVIPTALGPLLAGLIMDNADPRWVWYASGILGLVAAGAYYLLKVRADQAVHTAIDRRLDVVGALEAGRVSADTAADLLEGVEEGALIKLAPPRLEGTRRYVRVRVADVASGAIKADLRLPWGLVHTMLNTGGHLAAGLEAIDAQALSDALTRSAAGSGAQTLADGDDEIELSIESDE